MRGQSCGARDSSVLGEPRETRPSSPAPWVCRPGRDRGDLASGFELLTEPLAFQGDPLNDSGGLLELLAQLPVVLTQPHDGFLELAVAAGRRGLSVCCGLASEVSGDIGEIAPEGGIGQAGAAPTRTTPSGSRCWGRSPASGPALPRRSTRH
jgi:hypothetical protein